jgi:hypothetical protein
MCHGTLNMAHSNCKQIHMVSWWVYRTLLSILFWCFCHSSFAKLGTWPLRNLSDAKILINGYHKQRWWGKKPGISKWPEKFHFALHCKYSGHQSSNNYLYAEWLRFAWLVALTAVLVKCQVLQYMTRSWVVKSYWRCTVEYWPHLKVKVFVSMQQRHMGMWRSSSTPSEFQY